MRLNTKETIIRGERRISIGKLSSKDHINHTIRNAHALILCSRCPREVEEGKKKCSRCLEKQRKYNKGWSGRKGKCRDCKEKSVTNRTRCVKHLRLHRLYWKLMATKPGA